MGNLAEKRKTVKMTRKKFIVTAAILSAVIIAVPFACSETLKAVYYDIPAPLLGKPVKIAFLSDVHNTLYGAGMSELIGAVDSFAPDAVVFGGDLFDYVWEEKNSQLLITSLVQRYPCYYSLGNHEFKKGRQMQIKREVSSLGVHVLDGKYADLDTDGGTVRFIGIDGCSYTEQLDAAKDAVSTGCTNILINHYPEEFPTLTGCGFDLILSGHAHGGQWRFPPFNNGILSPGEGLFPKYAGGLYEAESTRMIVSRGLARSPRDIIIPRIFNRPEAVFITLS